MTCSRNKGRWRCAATSISITEIGLANLEVILALCEQMRERVSIQLVAFPQSGVRAAPGTAALLEEALKLGVETIGALDPAAIASDVKGQLDLMSDLAVR